MKNIDFNKSAEAQAIVILPDVALAKQSLEIYSQEIDKMVKLATILEVVDDASHKQAIAMGIGAKKLAKEITRKRDDFIREPNERVKAIRNFTKGFTDRLDGIELETKEKGNAYTRYQELARREAERRAEEARRELQKKLDAEAKRMHVEPIKVEAPIIEKAPTVTRTEAGSSYTVKQWKAEILDADQVPRGYCSPDPKKINEAVKMGVREIGGCKIYEKSETRYRT